jgi:hypothetical protein
MCTEVMIRYISFIVCSLHESYHREMNNIANHYHSTNTYIYTYSRFIPEGVAKASLILLRNAHVLPKLFCCEEYCRRDKWKAHSRLNSTNK